MSEEMKDAASTEEFIKKVDEEIDESDELSQITALSDFMSDPEKEEEGTWRSLNDGSGREFLVAHAENPKFKAKLARLMRPHMPTLRKRNEKAMRLTVFLQGKAMAGTILKDWRTKVGSRYESGLKTASGDYLAFDIKVVEAQLTDPRFRQLRTQIEEWAEVEDAYADSALEVASGN
jgi:hypothetical protein